MKDIGIGFFGSGNWAGVHARALGTIPQAGLVAVACGSRAPKFADTYGVDFMESPEKLLERDDIDAVVIATPHALHRRHAVLALEAGKNVLLEKPMAMTLRECDEIIAAAEKSKKKLMIAHSHRFWRGGQVVKELLNKGAIGKLYMVRDTLVTARGRLKERYSWHYDPKMTGRGNLFGYGCHMLDRLRWWFGKPVTSVSANCLNYPSGWPIESASMVFMKFEGEGSASLWSCSACPKPAFDGRLVCRAELLGEDGIIDCQTYGRVLLGKHDNGEFEEVYKARWPEDRKILIQECFTAEDTEFINCILEDRQSSIPGSEGRATVEVVLAAHKSADTGQSVSLPFTEYDFH